MQWQLLFFVLSPRCTAVVTVSHRVCPTKDQVTVPIITWRPWFELSEEIASFGYKKAIFSQICSPLIHGISMIDKQTKMYLFRDYLYWKLDTGFFFCQHCGNISYLNKRRGIFPFNTECWKFSSLYSRRHLVLLIMLAE